MIYSVVAENAKMLQLFHFICQIQRDLIIFDSDIFQLLHQLFVGNKRFYKIEPKLYALCLGFHEIYALTHERV